MALEASIPPKTCPRSVWYISGDGGIGACAARAPPRMSAATKGTEWTVQGRCGGTGGVTRSGGCSAGIVATSEGTLRETSALAATGASGPLAFAGRPRPRFAGGAAAGGSRAGAGPDLASSPARPPRTPPSSRFASRGVFRRRPRSSGSSRGCCFPPDAAPLRPRSSFSRLASRPGDAVTPPSLTPASLETPPNVAASASASAIASANFRAREGSNCALAARSSSTVSKSTSHSPCVFDAASRSAAVITNLGAPSPAESAAASSRSATASRVKRMNVEGRRAPRGIAREATASRMVGCGPDSTPTRHRPLPSTSMGRTTKNVAGGR